jgi:hypothetical protein
VAHPPADATARGMIVLKTDHSSCGELRIPVVVIRAAQ